MLIENLTAYEAKKLLDSKELSCLELTKSTLASLADCNKISNASIFINEEKSLKKAAEIDNKICKGERLNTPAGLQYAVKDNICTREIPTTCGSKILADYVPLFNAHVIDKLNDSILVSKLNMDEFAMGSSTETSYFGTVKNPRGTTRSPGGSSGGCAAAVCAVPSLLSIGSDTGGSVRLPASYCGVVGLKPTYGAVSRYGLIAFASSLEQIGPICSSVKDTAMLYDAICGYDSRDLTSVNAEHLPTAKRLTGDVRDLRIGIPEQFFSGSINDEVKVSVLSAVDILRKLGAQIVPVSIESSKYALSAYYVISSAEASSNLGRYDGVRYGDRATDVSSLEELFIKSRSEGFGREVKRRIMLGTFVLSEGYYEKFYLRAKYAAGLIKSEFEKNFSQVDIIATPTALATAPKLGVNRSPKEVYADDFCTVCANLCGIPAISVPCGFDNYNMPIGIQLMANRFNEHILLNTAYTLENELNLFPWSRRDSYVG